MLLDLEVMHGVDVDRLSQAGQACGPRPILERECHRVVHERGKWLHQPLPGFVACGAREVSARGGRARVDVEAKQESSQRVLGTQ